MSIVAISDDIDTWLVVLEIGVFATRRYWHRRRLRPVGRPVRSCVCKVYWQIEVLSQCVDRVTAVGSRSNPMHGS